MTKRKQKAKSNTEKAARAFGYQGPMSQLEKYKKSDPVFARKMAMVQDKLNMRKGGVVKLSNGSYLNNTGPHYTNQNTATQNTATQNTETVKTEPAFGSDEYFTNKGIDPEGKIAEAIKNNPTSGYVAPEDTTTSVEEKDPAFDTPIISSTSSTTEEDLGIDTDKGTDPRDLITEDDPAPLSILPDIPADDPPPVVDTGAEDIKSLFKTLLKRDIGAGALKHYEDRLAAGESIGDISNSIVNSEEYKTLTADPNKFPDKPTYDPVDVSKIGATTENQKVKFDKIEDEDVKTLTDPRDLITKTVVAPTTKDAIQTTATTTEADVKKEIDTLTAEQGTVSDKAQVDAITQDPTTSEVQNIKAAELDSPRVIEGTTRTLQDDELVSGPSVDQARVETDVIAKTKAEQLDLDPAATIKGQLSTLYQDFNTNNPPAWADGAVRTAMATLNARGMGASSLAGQAVVQAVMESALPIAQVDAKTVFDLGLQNLSNRQATVILAAQQRATFLGQEFDQEFQTKVANAAKISDIANQNFTAETQIAIENSKLAQTVDLANLSNRQAVIMAEAAQIANLETTNLTNRQAAAIQNAQSFLQMDLKNLENKQQTNLFKAQEQIKSLFTDAAAENAAAQFNASSENQVTQFYDSLSTQVKQFNATQTNATAQFNVSQSTAIDQFNAQQKNATDQFNASNGLVVSQANAEWRRNIATIDTAAQNQVNQFNAQMAMSLTQREYEGMWQEYRDSMTFAHETGENQLDRESQQFIALLNKQAAIESAKFAMTGELYQAGGSLAAAIASGSNLFGKGGLITSVLSKGLDSLSTSNDNFGLTDAELDFDLAETYEDSNFKLGNVDDDFNNPNDTDFNLDDDIFKDLKLGNVDDPVNDPVDDYFKDDVGFKDDDFSLS